MKIYMKILKPNFSTNINTYIWYMKYELVLLRTVEWNKKKKIYLKIFKNLPEIVADSKSYKDVADFKL